MKQYWTNIVGWSKMSKDCYPGSSFKELARADGICSIRGFREIWEVWKQTTVFIVNKEKVYGKITQTRMELRVGIKGTLKTLDRVLINIGACEFHTEY